MPPGDERNVIGRSFVHHYHAPFLAYPSTEPDDPRPWMVATLQEGREDEVIRRYDPRFNVIPEDPRTLLHLAGAHYQAGNVKRAQEISEAAWAHFNGTGNLVAKATAIAQTARGAWRRKGLDAAWTLNRRALLVDPFCRTARANNFCYASVAERLDLLQEEVEGLLHHVPRFDSDEFYVDFFLTDSQLAWARSQECLQDIMRRVNDAVQQFPVNSGSADHV